MEYSNQGSEGGGEQHGHGDGAYYPDQPHLRLGQVCAGVNTLILNLNILAVFCSEKASIWVWEVLILHLTFLYFE